MRERERRRKRGGRVGEREDTGWVGVRIAKSDRK